MRFFVFLVVIVLTTTGCRTTRKDVTVTRMDFQSEERTNVVPATVSNTNTQGTIKPAGTELPVKSDSHKTNNVVLPKTNRWVTIDSVAERGWVLVYSNEVYPKRCIISKGSRRLELTEDTQRCKYEGINVYLGYSPRWENGKCLIYSPDFDSTIKPLMETKPALNGKKPTIVIDPGHGGNDPGTISILSKKPEKEYTLDIARRLAVLLQAQGWNVILTRTNDARIELTSRAAFSQNSNVDAFVSIHLNYFDKSVNVQGLETYCLTPNGTASTLARGYADNVTTNYMNNKFDSENVALAAEIHKSLIEKLRPVDRGVRRARFMAVLQNQNCPAVLVEVCFLSSPNEAALIDRSEYRQEVAMAIADGLKNFYNRGN
jgi:N-acetylmuramoyl-L-alanine amidase